MAVPMDPFAGMPPLTVSPSAQSGASNYSTIAPSVLTPFNFDNSGWVVQVKSSGNPSAQGSTGANGGGLNSAPVGSSLAQRMNPMLIVGVLAVWLLMRNN